MATKFTDIADSLRSEIRLGKYKAGKPFPSEAMLARRFGAGRQTVIRAVSELAREGLLSRRRGSGTFLTPLAGRSTGRIGLILHGSDYCELFSPFARAISRLCQGSGLSLLFCDASGAGSDIQKRIDEVMRAARNFTNHGVDGVILQPVELTRDATSTNRSIAAVFDEASIPVVLIDSDMVPSPGRSAYDLAAVDHLAAGRRMAAHLRERGARRIAFLTQKDRAPCVLDRHLGLRIGCEGLVLAGEALYAEPDDAARIRRFVRREKPDAFFCYNDIQAVRLMKTLAAIGLRVPGDILVAGFDDVSAARLADPPLTTLRQPCDELAALAWKMLRERIVNPSLPPRAALLDAPLAVRESTGGITA